MYKYITGCLIGLCAAPTAFANLGEGFYITLGVGSGQVDYQQLQDFNLNYEALYTNILIDDELNQAVLDSFNDTAEYSDANESVIGGRIALGYLWDIFEGKPIQISDAVYTFNATLGFELGYRLFDDISDSLEKNVFDVTRGFHTLETVTQKFKTEAADFSAVARLPFTDDNTFALLLKAGAAYNFRRIDTTIVIDALSDNPPGPPSRIPYNRTITETNNHGELLPVFGGALEYMFNNHFGLSAEYSAIVGSSHNADNELIMGNLVFRL